MKFSKHSGVIAAFRRIDADIVRQLANAQDARNESDYRIADGSVEDAACYIGYAEDFIALGERLLSEKPSQVDEVDDDAE